MAGDTSQPRATRTISSCKPRLSRGLAIVACILIAATSGLVVLTILSNASTKKSPAPLSVAARKAPSRPKSAGQKVALRVDPAELQLPKIQPRPAARRTRSSQIQQIAFEDDPLPPVIEDTERPLPLFDPDPVQPQQVAQAEPVQRRMAPTGEARFSFNFQEAPWSLVLKKFAEEAGLSLRVGALPLSTYTYYDPHEYSLSQALDIFNDSLLTLGFIAIRNGDRLTVVSAKEKVPDGVVPLTTWADVPRLGRHELASVAVAVPSGHSSASMAQEFGEVLTSLGSAKPLSNSNRVLVTDVGGSLQRLRQLVELGEQDANAPVSFVYQLRNTPAEEVALAISDFLGSRRQSSNSSTTSTTGTTTSLRTPVNATTAGLSPLGTSAIVIAEKTTNSLLIRGTASEVAEIQELICKLDRVPPQVLIQALLVEVELGDVDEFGVELGVQDSVLFDRSVVDKLVTLSQTNTAPNGVQTTTQNVISQTANPGFNFNNQPLGNNTAIHPSRVGTQGLSSLGVGRINGDLGFGGLVLSAGSESISVLLRALQQTYHVDILSRPQIRSLDNHEALIQIGRQVPVVDGVSITAVGSANPVIRQDQSGIILKVVPRISPDQQVQIDVKAEKSAYLLIPGTGVPIFTDGTNGNVIEAPIKDITTAAATVNVRSGQTIVLGGMITRDTTNVTRKVPYLGDIPYLGAAFRYKLNDTKRKELLIFLTPIVIESDEDSDQLKWNEMQRITMPYDEAEQIHGNILPADYEALDENWDAPPVNSGEAEPTMAEPDSADQSPAPEPLPPSLPSQTNPQMPPEPQANIRQPRTAWRPFNSYRGPSQPESETEVAHELGPTPKLPVKPVSGSRFRLSR